jgi:hypothetical protein
MSDGAPQHRPDVISKLSHRRLQLSEANGAKRERVGEADAATRSTDQFQTPAANVRDECAILAREAVGS